MHDVNNISTDFQDYILWTDRKEMNGLHMARLDKEEKIRGIIHPKYGIAEDLVTFDIYNQPLYNSEYTPYQ